VHAPSSGCRYGDIPSPDLSGQFFFECIALAGSERGSAYGVGSQHTAQLAPLDPAYQHTAQLTSLDTVCQLTATDLEVTVDAPGLWLRHPTMHTGWCGATVCSRYCISVLGTLSPHSQCQQPHTRSLCGSPRRAAGAAG
jgi:hypothetical protein